MPQSTHRRSLIPEFAQPPSPTMEQALAEAWHLAQEAHDTGRLLTPAEAMALAGPEARANETLYSIARTVGWRRDADVDELLTRLGALFPAYR